MNRISSWLLFIFCFSVTNVDAAVRETIELPRRFPARHNKVPGGRPGAGEITSSRRVPPEAIKKVTPLR